MFLTWSCGHGVGETTHLRDRVSDTNQATRKAAHMKWNAYIAEEFSSAKEIRVLEFNIPPYVNGKASKKRLLTLDSKEPINKLTSVISVDEEQSGEIIDCLGEAHIAFELVADANDVISLLVTTDSITPPDKGSLFFTEESKSKLRKWFMKNIGRLPYGWDSEGCGE